MSLCISNAQKEQNLLVETQKLVITKLGIVSQDLKTVRHRPNNVKRGIDVFGTNLIQIKIIFSYLSETLDDLKLLPSNISNVSLKHNRFIIFQALTFVYSIGPAKYRKLGE